MSILARFWTFRDVSREINEEPNAVLIGQIHGDFKVTT